MTINFKNALSIHPQALSLREKRSEVIASNLANEDTPNYKARDMDFNSILKQSQSRSVDLNRTQEGHIHSERQLLGANLMFRNPYQASLDGNTVESNIEQAKYSENAVQYEASLGFVSSDFSGLITAIKGQ
ncbi:MAG: flagellar basal body rod protein FlgB [Methylovulum sp.]|jgi:flagellar basal-body rod protein FlgB|nr:flagellar basal body rod protein FlgB [Methylovulum sp.]MCF7998890.1 flagellar basal body rod protein FlgB [Methylovulum sp.]